MSNISVYYQELLRQWSDSKEGKYRLEKCGESGDWALLSFAGWLDENATSALRADLADAKARAASAEKGWHANEARIAKLESQLAWWLETYDITMPCGHKNRYLLTDGRGELIKEGNGDCVCVMCQLELSDKIEEILKSQ